MCKLNLRYKNLAKNSMIFLIANFGSKFLSFILVPFYTHVLNTGEYGTVDTLVSTVSLFSPIATLGIGDVIIMFLIKKIIFYITKRPKRFKRKLNFEKFNDENICFSRYWINKKRDRIKANKFYDLFVCGSDQIWNSEAEEIDGKYFADFADRKKRVSYAASFGIEYVVDERKKEFKKYLSEMEKISVREQTGSEVVEALINQRPECHIDPTLLLSKNKWDFIADKFKKPCEKYLFCYFLGKPTDHILNILNEYKKKNEKVNILSIWDRDDGTHNNVGPGEFLGLIKNAELILTDSFHGTVFSIIYHKPFYTFSRTGVKESMDTRVVSLLKLLELTDRFEPENITLDGVEQIDFGKSKIILDREKKRAIEYIEGISK